MILKGVDNGYKHTKDDQKRLFKSAYAMTDESLSGLNTIIIDGVTYYYGTGNSTADSNKIYDTVTKVCTIADLCMTGPGPYNLVVGLPVGQFKDHKDEFRDEIMSYNRSEVYYRSQKYRVQINDVAVCAQGASALYAFNQIHNCIILDLGSYTVNIAMFELDGDKIRLTKSDTIFKGINRLSEKVINAVNAEWNLTLDTRYADMAIRGEITPNGMKMDNSFIREILIDYLKPIFTQFKTTYPYQIYPIYLIGGGSILLYNVFQANFCNIHLVPDAMFANAIGYYKYGQTIWR